MPDLRHVSVRQILGRACWARNNSLTYGGRTPAEIAFGRRPPDILEVENMLPPQLFTEPTKREKLNNFIRDEALKAHLTARQRMDLRRDLAARLRASDGPFHVGQSIWFYDRDMSKIRGGEWIASRIVSLDKPPMVSIDLNNKVVRVNQSKIRKNPDPWHDVVIPGVTGRDEEVTVPGTTGTDYQHAME